MKNLIDYLLEDKINITFDISEVIIDEANHLIYKAKGKERDKYPITIQIGDHGKERQNRHISPDSPTFDKDGHRIETWWITKAIKDAMPDIKKLFNDKKIKVETPQEIIRTNKITGEREKVMTIPSFIITDTKRDRNKPLNIALYIEKYHINSKVFDFVVKTVYLGSNFKKSKSQQQILLY